MEAVISANAQCCNAAENLARMGNFDNFSMEICGYRCVHKCPGNMKQAIEKFIDVFLSGKHTAKSDDIFFIFFENDWGPNPKHGE